MSAAGLSSVKRNASDVDSLRESTDDAVKAELQEEDEEGNSLVELFVDASRKNKLKACKLCDAKPGDATPLKFDSRMQQGRGNVNPWGVGSVYKPIGKL